MLAMVRRVAQRSPGYGLLISGQVVSTLGDHASGLALSWLVLDLTHSTTAMGTIQALRILPLVLLLPFTGVIGDRLPRVGLMAATDVVRGLAMATAVLLVALDALKLPWLYALALVMGAGGAFFFPPYQAVRAETLHPEVRQEGNALSSMLAQVPVLAGSFVGAGLLALGGNLLALGVDASTYLFSLVMLVLLARVRRRTLLPAPAGAAEREPMLQAILGGWRIIVREPWLWVTIAVFSLVNIAHAGAITIILPWLVKIHLGLPPAALAACATAEGVGALVGGWLMGRRKARRRAWWAYAGVAISGLAILLLPLMNLPGMILLCVADGVGLAIFGILWETSLQEVVPPAYFSRVASLDAMGSLALIPLGAVAVGWAAEAVGHSATLVTMGLGSVALCALALSHRGVRAYD